MYVCTHTHSHTCAHIRQVHGPDGGLEMLRMDEHEFRDLATLLEEGVEEEEELEAQAATA